MCHEISRRFVLARVVSGSLARVNNGKLTVRRFWLVSDVGITCFAGTSRWAVQGSNLRPWD
jgi:hypothetical protein